MGLTADGIVGAKTIQAVNKGNSKELFDNIYRLRVKFLENMVVNNPSQKRFLNGWLNRLADFKYID